jgi:hypothetical protein
MKLNFLKFVYRGILTGMPILTYNPITKNTLNVPLTVKPYSTYLNFKLDNNQVEYLHNYINEYSDELELVPISIYNNEEKSYYLSVNIYNCSSPAFMNDDKEVTRCEINTYIKDKKGNYGTLIVDYLSNDLSMDPVNIFKFKNDVNFKNYDLYKIINCNSEKENIELKLNFTVLYDYIRSIDDELIKYTDNIYYKNGMIDKIYYDSSLVNAIVKSPSIYLNLSFIYKNLTFNKIDSIFYFVKEIRFIGGMWSNIYDL